MKILAVIPARCNSMRIRHKNIVRLDDKPLIQWTIDASRESILIDDTAIITDCREVKAIAREAGICSLEIKGHDFEKGEASDAVVKAVEFNPGYDLAVMLLPTSPFRRGTDIDCAIRNFANDTAHSLISVSPANVEMRKLRWVDGRRLRQFTKQTLCESNGAIQITTPAHLLKHRTFHAGEVMPYWMDAEMGLDIDMPSDLHRARIIAERLRHARVPA